MTNRGLSNEDWAKISAKSGLEFRTSSSFSLMNFASLDTFMLNIFKMVFIFILHMTLKTLVYFILSLPLIEYNQSFAESVSFAECFHGYSSYSNFTDYSVNINFSIAVKLSQNVKPHFNIFPKLVVFFPVVVTHTDTIYLICVLNILLIMILWHIKL